MRTPYCDDCEVPTIHVNTFQDPADGLWYDTFFCGRCRQRFTILDTSPRYTVYYNVDRQYYHSVLVQNGKLTGSSVSYSPSFESLKDAWRWVTSRWPIEYVEVPNSGQWVGSMDVSMHLLANHIA